MEPQTKQVNPVVWKTDRVLLIDQRCLPNQYQIVEICRSEDMAQAIENMTVRGAPAIAIAAAYGLYLGATEIKEENVSAFLPKLEQVAARLRETRPTAVNLVAAIAQMMKTAYEPPGTAAAIKANLLQTAHTIQWEDLAICRAIGNYGVEALPKSPKN